MESADNTLKTSVTAHASYSKPYNNGHQKMSFMNSPTPNLVLIPTHDASNIAE